MFFSTAAAASNPYAIYENAPQNGGGAEVAGFSNTSGRTSTTTLLTSGETTLIQLLVGDSTAANSGVSAYSPVNTKNENLNPYNGLNYRYADPYLGASGGAGSYPGRTADKLITAGKFARVITIGSAIGGSTSRDHSKLGAFNHRTIAALMYARKYGWPVSGAADSWRMAVIYQLGINDNYMGLGASQLTTNALSCFQSLRDYGFQGKIFVAKSTMVANAVNSGIQAAQVALVNNPNGIYAGADMDSLTGANRQADGIHFSDVGNDALAGLWQAIFAAEY
jgi:hypothetical protein